MLGTEYGALPQRDLPKWGGGGAQMSFYHCECFFAVCIPLESFFQNLEEGLTLIVGPGHKTT